MEFYKEILNEYYKEKTVEFLGDNTVNLIVEGKCYNILKQIKLIVENKQLSDKDCFNAIEEIVCAFEENGVKCSYRHDF